jgi:hypothetical protein
MIQTYFVLVADDLHARLLQFRKLLLRRPFPQTNVSIETGVLVLPGIRGILQPDGYGKITGVA